MAWAVRRLQVDVGGEQLDAGPEVRLLSLWNIWDEKAGVLGGTWTAWNRACKSLIQAKIGIWNTRRWNDQSCVPRLSCFSSCDCDCCATGRESYIIAWQGWEGNWGKGKWPVSFSRALSVSLTLISSNVEESKELRLWRLQSAEI